MRQVNLPEGFPRLAILLRLENSWYCSLCGLPAANLSLKVHDVPSCGAEFVAVASSLGRFDLSLRARGDLQRLDVMPQLRQPPTDWWMSADEAEVVVRDARLRRHPFDSYFTAGKAGNIVSRLYSFGSEQVERYDRPAPFRTRQLEDGTKQVELRSAVRFFGPRGRKIYRIGAKAQANLRRLVEYLDQQYDQDHGPPAR